MEDITLNKGGKMDNETIQYKGKTICQKHIVHFCLECLGEDAVNLKEYIEHFEHGSLNIEDYITEDKV